jgi:lipoic acid synthetase
MKNTIDPNKPKVKLPGGRSYLAVKNIVIKHGLNTICQSGKCPNLAECWGNGTATFMILGNICTRSCRFCSVVTGKPLQPDPTEPDKIAQSVKIMKLKHCVITSVDRDDLHDGGALHWYKTIIAVRELNPATTIEVLIPDFKFNKESLDMVISANPEIISHNLETVERLTKEVRVQAKYARSLDVLNYLSEKGACTKSGIMVGLGETKEEILKTMDDLLQVNCKILTIGQYLQPTPENLQVVKFYSDEEFKELKKAGMEKGFTIVESGNLVRSSYHAEKHLM